MISKPVIGVIGTIGAGKSEAAAALARRGGSVVDADRIGHDVLDESPVYEELVARWGDRILHQGGRINRRAVAAIVFANDAERKALEAMVYPAIESRCREEIELAQLDATVKFIVLDAAVMLEAGWKGIVTKYLFINALREKRLRRVAVRGWSETDLASREAAQWPAETKKVLADAVIINDGSSEDLQLALDQQLTQWGWL